MITWHVTAIAGPQDDFHAPVADGEKELVVPFGIPTHPDRIESSVAKALAGHRLELRTAAEDLLHLATAAYTADLRIPRDDGFGDWTRDLRLHAFVRDAERWMAAAPLIERLLSFLTGDHWRVDFRAAPAAFSPERLPPPKKAVALTGKDVCLFSGGLDSYIGAIDLAARSDGQIILVGHHSADGGATSRSQKQALAALRRFYDDQRTPFLRMWVSPPKGDRASETTTRGRSILFFALGIAVADAAGADRLVVPENGFISLNVPLSPSRGGSFSTRTTHPQFVALVREVLAAIGVGVSVELPYRFQTKGEMMKGIANAEALAVGLPVTMSCAHPSVGRWAKQPNVHCGRCVPCIIRRAAVHSAMQDPTTYKQVDLKARLRGKSGSDLTVVRMALDRYASRAPRISDILTAGPLPVADDEKRAFLGVFTRGIEEIRAVVG